MNDVKRKLQAKKKKQMTKKGLQFLSKCVNAIFGFHLLIVIVDSVSTEKITNSNSTQYIFRCNGTKFKKCDKYIKRVTPKESEAKCSFLL